MPNKPRASRAKKETVSDKEGDSVMSRLTPDKLAHIMENYGGGVDGLNLELRTKLERFASSEESSGPINELAFARAVIPSFDIPPSADDEVGEERIIAATAGARPVARILNNQATTDFIGPDSESWGNVIRAGKPMIDKAIPAVGRIELNNSDYPWAGTGWLIAPRIIVTNRHVAELFAKTDRKTASFTFRPGLAGGSVSADIDFLEEENRLDSAEHPITSILWVAPPDDDDVAFLQISQASGLKLPDPVDLVDEIEAGETIVAIGYPARDPTIRDQQKVIAIFGPDVYDKKRLSPGKVKSVDGNRIKHDCSTLGGNSGSLLLELKTGRAIGIHRAGLLDDSANLGVTASRLRALLAKALQAAVHRPEEPAAAAKALPGPPHQLEAAAGIYRMNFQIPIEVIIKVGGAAQLAATADIAVPATQGPAGPAAGFETALQKAQDSLLTNPNVLRVRAGYRFKNGWITDERVVVVEVKEKVSYGDLLKAGESPLPREILGVGVDVRTAPLPVQLEELGVEFAAEEKVARAAAYKEPAGYDNEDSEMFLGAVKETMDAIFHVSPDAGFSNLKAFLGRVERHLTATMYEWQPNHVSDAIEAAMTGSGRTLRMVTQKKGVGGVDATESAVADMKDRIGNKFKHVWASVRGPHRLIPSSYHIKVASRDGAEVWLSSGNWKDSNQPKNPTTDSALRKFNREWHAIIKNERLATLFQKYIEYDFAQATRFPLEEAEAPAFPDIDLFIPDEALDIALERIPSVTYQDQMKIEGEELDIQPLLTPDRDARGRRLFMKFATDMIQRATRRILIQNQSFSFTDENNDEFDRFFAILKQKQESIDDVRVIFRDAKDYHRAKDLEKQQELIERLKDFGLNTSPDAVRLQMKCHTKGIIIDSEEVLLGSQNLTNEGALFNRDASVLVRSPKVASFYEKIFEYDWDNLTNNDAEERVGGIRRAAPGEPTPPGFTRVKLSDLLAEE
jgi:V8-like Glu-specific endopeptidase